MPNKRGRVAGGGAPAGARCSGCGRWHCLLLSRAHCWLLYSNRGPACQAPGLATHLTRPRLHTNSPTLLLQTPENAKAILARGVAALPDSVKLWMQAARLEQTDAAKKRVLLRCAGFGRGMCAGSRLPAFLLLAGQLTSSSPAGNTLTCARASPSAPPLLTLQRAGAHPAVGAPVEGGGGDQRGGRRARATGEEEEQLLAP